MVSLIFKSALLAASLINVATAQSTAAQPIATPTSHPQLQALKYGGCFDNPGHMVDYGPATFQSTANCAPICAGLKKPVMALVDGANCWCGDLGPASGKVDDSDCTTPCQGYDKETCGGNQHWAFFSSGLTAAQINYEEDAASSSAAPSSAAPTSQATQPTQKPGETTIVQTVPGSVQTETDAPKPTNANDNNGGGSNKTAIAVGVVVGIVALAAICGAAFLFLRRRKQKRAEESYRHHQSMQNFTSGKPPGTSHSSLTDNRLDPEIMMRRQSDGSIADNQDYSRRILQVTNI